MKPKDTKHERQRDRLRRELIMLVNRSHPMVKLAGNINRAEFDRHLGAAYHEKLGQSGLGTRLPVSVHYLKHQYNPGDEEALEHWVENPCWRCLSGMRYFEHDRPMDS